ncbi:MAG: hypothetical protein NXI01_02090 [Gammaproteobacteria bacterium]|nr:hypothetical protein [Gammaproteobacteria bacterium]
MHGKTSEMQQIDNELWDEFSGSGWISGEPASQAVLLAAKKEHRLEKNRPFNGFVLEQKSLDDSEFTQFIDQLRETARVIPPGTRIQLAVLTRFVDPDYEWSIEYEEGKRTCAHWTAVDLLVGEGGQVSSFVLDAANAQGFQRIHARLKEIFPEGKHYVYKSETVYNESKGRDSPIPIQTLTVGCRVFAIEHLKQLSQLTTATLYGKELPLISTEKGEIKASNFTGGLKLSRIFRGMQTWTGLSKGLSEAVQNTPLKDTSSETVIEYAERQSIMEGEIAPIKKNETIARKNTQYMNKKRDYYQSLSPEMQQSVVENRRGFAYLQHPQLFKLSDMLSSIETYENNDALMVFIQDFSWALQEHDAPEEARHCLEALTALSTATHLSPGAIKHSVLTSVTGLYQALDTNNHLDYQSRISEKIDRLYRGPSENPVTKYRKILQAQQTDSSSSDSDTSKRGDSPASV